MSTPNNLEESLRCHDAAIVEWLSNCHVDYGSISGKALNNVPILWAFASPSRAFAAIPDRLVALNWIAGSTADEQRVNAAKLEVMPLPLVSIERADPQQDAELAGAPKTFRTSNYNATQDKFAPHAWPGMYKVEYTLTFWGNKRYTDNFLREWVLAQVGQKGARNAETFIVVRHAAPWGNLLHSLTFTGSSDQSDLEGEQDRFIRCAFTFELRFLLFRSPLPLLDPVNAIGEDINQPSLDYGELNTDGDKIEDYGNIDRFSSSLYVDLMASFPNLARIDAATLTRAFGAAFTFLVGQTVIANDSVGPKDEGSPARTPTLRIDTQSGADSICLLERPINADGSNVSLVGMSFRYTASQDVTLELRQKNPSNGTITTIFRLTLTASARWRRIHFFAFLTQPIVQAWIVGASVAATVRLFRVDVRNFSSGVQTPSDAVANVGGQYQYVWTTLPTVPLLVIAKLTSSSGSVFFDVLDDKDSPTFTNRQSIDSSRNVGAVALIQPKQSSILVKVPNTTILDSVYVQPYLGAFNGND